MEVPFIRCCTAELRGQFQLRPNIAMRGLEGVPGLHGAPQDEAGLTRKFETSPVLVPHSGWKPFGPALSALLSC